MKFKKSPRKAKVALDKNAKNPDPGSIKVLVPFSGDALTKLVRGFYGENKETALAASLSELVALRGYKQFKTKEGKLEVTAVMEGKKRFKGSATDKKSVLTTALEKKAV
jgi:hypothetical protein